VEQLAVVPRSEWGSDPCPAEELSGSVTSPGPHIELKNHSAPVLIVNIRVAKQRYGLGGLLADLTEVVEQVHKSPNYRAIVLASDYPGFVPQIDEEDVATAAFALQR